MAAVRTVAPRRGRKRLSNPPPSTASVIVNTPAAAIPITKVSCNGVLLTVNTMMPITAVTKKNAALPTYVFLEEKENNV